MSETKVYLVYVYDELMWIFASNDLAERFIGATYGWLEDYSEVGIKMVVREVITSIKPEIVPYEVALFEDGSVRSVAVESRLAQRVWQDEEYPTLVRLKQKPTYIRVWLWAKTEDEAVRRAQSWRLRYIEQGRWVRNNNW